MEHMCLKRSDVMLMTNLSRSLENPDAMIIEYAIAAGMVTVSCNNLNSHFVWS